MNEKWFFIGVFTMCAITAIAFLVKVNIAVGVIMLSLVVSGGILFAAWMKRRKQ